MTKSYFSRLSFTLISARSNVYFSVWFFRGYNEYIFKDKDPWGEVGIFSSKYFTNQIWWLFGFLHRKSGKSRKTGIKCFYFWCTIVLLSAIYFFFEECWYVFLGKIYIECFPKKFKSSWKHYFKSGKIIFFYWTDLVQL